MVNARMVWICGKCGSIHGDNIKVSEKDAQECCEAKK